MSSHLLAHVFRGSCNWNWAIWHKEKVLVGFWGRYSLVLWSNSPTQPTFSFFLKSARKSTARHCWQCIEILKRSKMRVELPSRRQNRKTKRYIEPQNPTLNFQFVTQKIFTLSWILNFIMNKSHLEGSLKHIFLGPTLGDSDSVIG